MEKNKIKKIQFLKINKVDGQKLITHINKKYNNITIIDRKYKIIQEKEYLFFPLIENDVLLYKLLNSIKNVVNIELISKKPKLNVKYKYKTVQDALKNKIPDKLFYMVPKSYDIIGNIAIVEFNQFNELENEEINTFKISIAKAIKKVNKNVNVIYEKGSEISGKYRLRELNFLHGVDKSETIHKENNCFFKLDIKKTFFSPRLVYERNRIASKNFREDEIIIDLFAGVGTFPIQIAKNHDIKIITFDINPYAYFYLNENIKLNKIKGKIISNNLDVKILLDPLNKLGNSLKNSVDRIIMNLPESSIDFIDVVCFLMKNSGGILHFYQFSEKPNPIEKSLQSLNKKLNLYNWSIELVMNSKIVKTFSPKSDLIVLDLIIKPIGFKK